MIRVIFRGLFAIMLGIAACDSGGNIYAWLCCLWGWILFWDPIITKILDKYDKSKQEEVV